MKDEGLPTGGSCRLPTAFCPLPTAYCLHRLVGKTGQEHAVPRGQEAEQVVRTDAIAAIGRVGNTVVEVKEIQGL